VNIRTFGRVVQIQKVLIITGTSSKIREMKSVMCVSEYPKKH